jgi:uncharacterized protein with beta-barrel porin domain
LSGKVRWGGRIMSALARHAFTKCFITAQTRGLLHLVAGLCVAAASGAAGGQGTSNLYTDPTSVTVPFTNVQSGQTQLDALPQLKIGFNGSSTTRIVTMDTGSTGILVSPDVFTPPAGAVSLGPGTQTYTSSGIVNHGTWYQANVDLYSGTNVVATASVPVLVVASQTCLQNARSCVPTSSPSGVSLFGIGFGQEAAGQPQGFPNRNAFLNIVSTGAGGPPPSPGYLLTATGVQLGLTAANTQGFAMVKLAPDPPNSIGGSEWLRAPASVVVNGVVGSGTILTDTGVSGMFLTPSPGTSVQTITIPGAECNSSCAATGTTVAVFMPGQTSPVASYQFAVGRGGGPQTGNPLAPDFVTVDAAGNPTFVNTSFHFLNGFDYFYDEANGFVGYRWNGSASSAYGGASPIIALQGSFGGTDGFQTNMPVYLMGSAGQSSTTTTLSSAGIATFAGPISGSGGLTIAGGAVALLAANTYTGGTTVINATAAIGSDAAFGDPSGGLSLNGGTLSPLAPLSLTRPITLLGSGGTIAAGGNAVALSGVVSGSGGLTIVGGTVALLAANTYTGGTTVINATAAIGSDAAFGDPSGGVSLNGGTLSALAPLSSARPITLLGSGGTIATGGNAVALSGAVSGGGGLAVSGGGTVSLTGTNSYTGPTTVTGTTLAVGSSALGPGGLTLSNATLQALGDLTYAGPVTLAGNKDTIDAGNSQVTLTGAIGGSAALTSIGNVLMTGPVSLSAPHIVQQGLLSANGTLSTPSLTIGSAGVLRGTGTISAPTIVGGTLAPGNSPGTLTFTAPVTMQPGSTLQIDIDGPGTGTGAGNYGRVLGTGPEGSFTAAGTLAPLLRGIAGIASNTYAPPVGQSFTVVRADGGVLGSFGGIAQPAAGLLPGSRFDALYGPNSLTLVVTPAAYGNLGRLGVPESASQAAVGTALDIARPAAGVTMSPAQSVIYAPLYGSPAGSIAGTLDQLSPTIYGDGLITARDSWYLVSSAIGDHLYATRGNPAPAGVMTAPNALGGTVWMTGLAQFGDTGANNAPGYNATTPGVALGADVSLAGDLTAGVALGYTTPQTSAKNAASLSADTLVVQAYGAWQHNIAFAEGYAGGMAVEGNSTRPLGIYRAVAHGVTSGSAGGGAVRAGVRLDLSGWAVEPSLGLAGVSLHQPPLTETGAGPLSLASGSSSVASIRSLVGVRAATRFEVSPDAVIVPTLQLGWSHEYADQHAQTFAAFTGAPAASFSVSSSATGRDAAIVGAGANVHLSAPLSLYAAYRGEFRGLSSAQQVTGGLRFVW